MHLVTKSIYYLVLKVYTKIAPGNTKKLRYYDIERILLFGC